MQLPGLHQSLFVADLPLALTDADGTLNHLNAHCSMQKHGPKRLPAEFKEIRKAWRQRKKAEEASKSSSKKDKSSAAVSDVSPPSQRRPYTAVTPTVSQDFYHRPHTADDSSLFAFAPPSLPAIHMPSLPPMSYHAAAPRSVGDNSATTQWLNQLVASSGESSRPVTAPAYGNGESSYVDPNSRRASVPNIADRWNPYHASSHQATPAMVASLEEQAETITTRRSSLHA